jgi:hypothetical protein
MRRCSGAVFNREHRTAPQILYKRTIETTEIFNHQDQNDDENQ